MKEIIIRNQEELDAIPVEFEGIIRIDCGETIVRVEKKYLGSVDVIGNSTVYALGNSKVTVFDHSTVEAYEHSEVHAFNKSIVKSCKRDKLIDMRNI